MKIALIGAPSSGKTELAQQLAQQFNLEVVDDYVAAVEARSNIVLGHYGTYIGNMQVAMARFEAERLAEKNNSNLVVCGTLVETAVYQAINAYTLASTDDEGGGFRIASDRRSNLTMTFFGVMSVDTFDYSHVFYLPLTEEYRNSDANVDNQIPAAAEALNVPYTTLSTDWDAKLSEAVEILENDEDEAKTPTPVGQTVGDSGEEGEGVGDSD